MSNCCCPPTAQDNTACVCPASRTVGKAVDTQTVKALLTEQALRRLTASNQHHFCADPACDIVYFDAADAVYRRTDVRVPVWQKEPFGRRVVCYCFGESEERIRMEIRATGRSAAVERIRENISAGRCACEVRNPLGTCCLGEVMAAVTRLAAFAEQADDPNPLT
jgi:hypothetical protein